jgi:hypothetical protein
MGGWTEGWVDGGMDRWLSHACCGASVSLISDCWSCLVSSVASLRSARSQSAEKRIKTPESHSHSRGSAYFTADQPQRVHTHLPKVSKRDSTKLVPFPYTGMFMYM